MSVPPCTTQDFYEGWNELKESGKDRRHWCADCTPSHKASKLADGECDKSDWIFFWTPCKGTMRGGYHELTHAPRRPPIAIPLSDSNLMPPPFIESERVVR